MTATKTNLDTLAKQINQLSLKEQFELATKLNIVEIIKNLPTSKNYKENNDSIPFYHSEQRNKIKDLEVSEISELLINCILYTDKYTNEQVLSFESGNKSGLISSRYTIPMPRPKNVSSGLISYLRSYIMELFCLEEDRFIQILGETVFRKLKEAFPDDFLFARLAEYTSQKNPLTEKYQGNPEDFEIVTHIRKEFFQQVKQHLIKDQEEENLKQLAYYKNLYEAELKNLKSLFGKIYNDLNHKIPSKQREAKARRKLLKETTKIKQKEVINKIDLKFKVADEAIILAAKECCLNPFSKSGNISSQIREKLKLGQDLLKKQTKYIPNNNY